MDEPNSRLPEAAHDDDLLNEILNVPQHPINDPSPVPPNQNPVPIPNSAPAPIPNSAPAPIPEPIAGSPIQAPESAATTWSAVGAPTTISEDPISTPDETQTVLEAAPPKKKGGRIVLIAAALALICAGGYFLFTLVLSPMLAYNKAKSQMEAGEFDEAIAGFEALEDYRDSPGMVQQAQYRKAQAHLEDGEFDTAIREFGALGAYEDSKDLQKEAKYRKAVSLMEKGQFDDALTLFVGLGSYSDAAVMAKETSYRKAGKLLEDGQFDEAITLYTELGDYADSAAQIDESNYRKAQAAFDAGRYYNAMELFGKLGDYRDSAERSNESCYELAKTEAADEDFEAAYTHFTELGAYEDSAAKAEETLHAWIDFELGETGGSYNLSDELLAVEPDDALRPGIYEHVLTYVDEHSDNTVSDWYYSYATEKLAELLEYMVPEGYEQRDAYYAVLHHLYGNHYEFSELFDEHEEDIVALWDTEFLQKLFEDENFMIDFMVGSWRSNTGYKLSFDEDNNANTTLPMPSSSQSSHGYSLNNLELDWTDSDDNVISQVFRFTLVDFDTVDVYSYSAGTTYTMHRQ